MLQENFTLENLPEIARKIIANTQNKILLFYANMGCGKTTLIKEIIKQLGVEDNVSSPTFSLVNEYITTKGETIFHFDFYRIENENEALDIGIEEYFYQNAWCFIEWPENIENLLPLDAVKIYLKQVDEFTREIYIATD